MLVEVIVEIAIDLLKTMLKRSVIGTFVVLAGLEFGPIGGVTVGLVASVPTYAITTGPALFVWPALTVRADI
jgi:hypothetical protein